MIETTQDTFIRTLSKNNVTLERERATTLQINTGLLCDRQCAHCHLSAGPERKELMSRETMKQVVDFASAGHFEAIDITGGAPELNPDLFFLIESLMPLNAVIMLRSNLSALQSKGKPLTNFLRDNRIHIVTSFPSLNELQTESIRGKGSFRSGIETLTMLNELGYGLPDSGFMLDLVVNPSGAFLPPSQQSLEKLFKTTLEQKYNIRFNRLFCFANAPLGRFRSWLQQSQNFEGYMQKLVTAFSPSAAGSLMCRTLLSVSWDGYLFDCDFNQAARLFMGNRKTHITELTAPPAPGSSIAVGEHCFTCTAGTGFT